MCEKHPDSIDILWEKFTNLSTCLWDVQIFLWHQKKCQAIGRPYTNCSLDFLGGTHEKAKWSGLQMTVLALTYWGTTIEGRTAI